VPLTALLFELDNLQVDRLSDALLAAGAVAVSYEDAYAGCAGENPIFDEPGEPTTWARLRFTVLLRASDDPSRLFAQASAACGLAAPPAYALEAVADTDWVRKSEQQFAPIRVSERLWIVPSWHAPPEPDAINLLLDPGLAFGTGSHPTTRLCLGWLERHVRGGDIVLDYGTGSGILAIAALKLGARRAVGIDIDTDAVSAARANAHCNRVSAEFQDTRASLTLAADLVVANILANPLKLLAPLLAGYSKRGARLALSGILVPQTSDVTAAYAPWFSFDAPAEDEGWVCLSGVRR